MSIVKKGFIDLLYLAGEALLLAATKQLYEWFFLSVRLSVCPSVPLSVCLSVCPSVRPSVRPSVCHTFLTFLTMFLSSYHHEIVRSYHQGPRQRPCKRSRSEVKGQGHRGHNTTSPFPDWNSSEFTYDDEIIHIPWCCLGEVPYCFTRSSVKFQGHTALKIIEFEPDWGFLDCNSSLNSPMAMKCCTKLEVA